MQTKGTAYIYGMQMVDTVTDKFDTCSPSIAQSLPVSKIRCCPLIGYDQDDMDHLSILITHRRN